MMITELLKELNAVGHKVGEYAITGSGALAVKNLRDVNGLDIIVLPEVWNRYTND